LDAFNPYYKWLGIPPEEQPPTHYRLLGLRIFEQDSDVIESAAEQRMMLLRSRQSGPHAAACQRLLNEIAAAKSCLLDADARRAYNTHLQGQANERAIAPPIAAPGSALLPAGTPPPEAPPGETTVSPRPPMIPPPRQDSSAEPPPPPLPPREPIAGRDEPLEREQDVVDALTARPPVDSWHVQTPDGSYWGPASRDELEAWAAEGRLTPGSYLLRSGTDQWIDAAEILPLAPPSPASYTSPSSYPGSPSVGYRCPHCHTDAPPMMHNTISAAGWVVFTLLLLFCFPLCFLGLLITEPRRTCSRCGYPV
jgi:hypothetical protein